MGKLSKEIKLIMIKDGNNKMFSSMWEKVMKRKCISTDNLVSKRCLHQCGDCGGRDKKNVVTEVKLCNKQVFLHMWYNGQNRGQG